LDLRKGLSLELLSLATTCDQVCVFVKIKPIGAFWRMLQEKTTKKVDLWINN